MESGKYYVLASGNNLFEGMSKEEVYDAIISATGNVPTGIDDAFITKIKELNKDKSLRFWIGTVAEYNALESYIQDCFYIFTDGDDLEDIIVMAENAAEAKAIQVCNGKQNAALSGTTDPDNSIGENGDIYFKYEA